MASEVCLFVFSCTLVALILDLETWLKAMYKHTLNQKQGERENMVQTECTERLITLLLYVSALGQVLIIQITCASKDIQILNSFFTNSY